MEQPKQAFETPNFSHAPSAQKRRLKRPPGFDTETLAGVLQGRAQVLAVCISESWGGLEQVAALDTLELARLGIEVHLLCLRESPIFQFIEDRNLEADASGKPRVHVFPLHRTPRDFVDLELKRILKWMIHEEGVNLVHVHQTSLLGSIVPWLWREPHVVLVASRHIMNNHNKKGPFHTLLYRRLDAIIAMSETLRRNILDTHRVRDWQVKVVHYGLDFDRFDPAHVDPKPWRESWGADAESIVIGLVGRIDPAKGQAEFIKAAAGLTKSGAVPSEKLKFVIVGEETLGSTSSLLAELRALVKQLHLEDRVVFAGFQKNIPEVMRAMDIVVMPSRQEAFGLVAIEAMAMERPIVISRGGSASEIVGKEEFGLLIRPRDPFDLQRQLAVLLRRPKLREEMGRKARHRVIREYDRKVRVQKTLQLYDHLLRKRGI